MVTTIIIIVVVTFVVLYLAWCTVIAVGKHREGKKIERQIRSMRELETSLMAGVFEANKKAKDAAKSENGNG